MLCVLGVTVARLRLDLRGTIRGLRLFSGEGGGRQRVNAGRQVGDFRPAWARGSVWRTSPLLAAGMLCVGPGRSLGFAPK